MALRIIPADTHLSTFTHTPSRHNIAPSAPGLHDTLRAGLSADPFAPSTQPISSHPLESRLKNWEATREALRMEILRRTYGIAEPIRRQMELKICRESEWKPMYLPGSGTPSVHEDILSGKDTTIEWEDVFTGGDEELRGRVGVHEEMERKVKMAPQ